MSLQSLLYQLVVKSKGALLDSTLEYLLDFPDFARHFVPPMLTFNLKEEVGRLKEFKSFTISHLISRFVEDSDDCVWVISSDPGRGKSTVVKELAHQLSKQQKYVWKIELRNFYTYYQDKPASSADLSVSEFLSHELPLTAERIAHILKNEKAFVFLDGFDEICSDFRRDVLKLIGELIQKKAGLLIASRPQEETEISNALQKKGIRAKKIHILPLDRNQQIKLLQLQPKNKKSKEECKKMLEDFERLGLSFFMENPIQLTLLAQVEKEINLFDIYDKVVDLKIENEMKVKEECVDDKEPIFEETKEARKNILNEVALKMLNGESVKMKPRDMKKLNRTGIAAIVGGRLHFVHQTFAEFLVLLGYITELKDKGVSNINIFDDCLMNCRQFLDDWLSVRKDTENEVWNKVVNDLKSKCTIQILKTNIVEENQPRLFEDVFEKFSIQDLIKESILEVALSKSGGITSKLLEYEESQNYLRENTGLLLDVSNSFPLEVYEKMKSICPKMILSWATLEDKDMVAVAARWPGRLGMLEFLANNGWDVNGLNGAGENALHKASEYGVVESVELLLSIPGIEIDCPDGGQNETAMHYAARGTGDPKIAELLWKKGFDLDALDVMDRTPLHKACQKGNVDFVKFLLEKGAEVDLYDNYEWKTALHLASENGHFECVELLLKSGAEVNETDSDDRTALHWACGEGNLECVELLLNSNAQIDLKDNQDKTALNLASENGYEKVVKLLLLYDCDVQSPNDRGSTALQLACESGQTNCVRYILNNKADINVKDEEDETVLHYAARGGSAEIMKMLLAGNPIEQLSAQTADEEGLLRPSGLEVFIDQKNIYGKTALHVAAKEGKLEVLKTILEAGANVTVIDENGWNAIHFAASEGKLEVAKYLNEVDGSLITEQTNEGETALHLAAAERNDHFHLPPIYNWLVETCVDTKATDKRGWNALHRAAKEGNLKAAKLLREKEPSLMKMETKKGETALHLAAENDRDIVAICEWLLFNDVTIDAVDDEGWNAIHKAIRCNNYLVAKFLHKKDVNLVKQNTKKGETALHLASMTDYETLGYDHSLFEWVHKQTNDYAAVDDEGWTTLHHAVRWGDFKLSKLLCKSFIEMKTKNGETALHLAVMRSSISKNWDFCNVLIKKGVDVKAVDKDGKNALHRAIERNSARVAKLLLHKEDQNLIMLTTDNGDTCLHLAASVYIYDDESKRKALYQWLKENGEDGRALKMAIKEINKLPTEERARKVQELEESLIKKKTEDGSSALDLLKAGVLTKHDFHSVDSENFEYCCLGFIEWLLENKIDPHAVNKDGKTALECANSTFVKEYLSRKMK